MAEVAPQIVLTGFMAAGKSAAAAALAERLGLEARDSDAEVEAAAGKTVAEIFESEGEAGFREREERAITGLLESGDDLTADVIALGGGALGSERVRDALAGHLVVWCDVDEETAWERREGLAPITVQGSARGLPDMPHDLEVVHGDASPLRSGGGAR